MNEVPVPQEVPALQEPLGPRAPAVLRAGNEIFDMSDVVAAADGGDVVTQPRQSGAAPPRGALTAAKDHDAPMPCTIKSPPPPPQKTTTTLSRTADYNNGDNDGEAQQPGAPSLGKV